MKLTHSKVSSVCSLAVVLALTQGLSGCSDFDNGYTEREIAYKEGFIDMFGEPDPNHTWNTAEQITVKATINMEGIFTVKVWTANPRYSDNRAYLLGQYDNVEGGTTHSFLCDIPSTVRVPYVGIVDKDGNRIILPAELKNGVATVEFGVRGIGGTRTVYSGTRNNLTIDSTAQQVFVKEAMQKPLETLPEYGNNTGKVSQNFEYVSKGSFTIYPIYSITSNKGMTLHGESLGIYTYKANGTVYTNKDAKDDGKTIAFADGSTTYQSGGASHNISEVVADSDPYITWIWQATPYWLDARQTNNHSQWEHLYSFNYRGTDHKETDKGETVKYYYDDETGKFLDDKYDAIRTVGIRVEIASGTRFGMVLDTREGFYYSNSDFNKDEGAPVDNSTTPDDVNDTYAATFYDDGQLYLAFEDWNYGAWGHDNDFNDVVFTFAKDDFNPLILDKDVLDVPMTYIVACEDLGGTFDWDFNDVVFGIEHVSGLTKARLKLLAAGGTLPAQIEYAETEASVPITIQFYDRNGELKSDLHDAFGVPLKTPVNVGGYSADPLYSEYFTVSDINSFYVSSHANRFKIKVNYEDVQGTYTSQGDGTTWGKIQIPDESGEKREPQAFLVADPNWKWPSERQNITTKYSTFPNWVTNHLKDSWCKSIWGETHDALLMPEQATNVRPWVEFNDNVATFPLNCEQMRNYTYYDLGIVTSAHAKIEFFKPKSSTSSEYEKILAMPDGEIVSGKRTTFMFGPDVLKTLDDIYKENDSKKMGYVRVTFDSGVSASAHITQIYWYGHNSIAKFDPELSIIGAGSGSSYLNMVFESNDRATKTIEYTSLSDGLLTYSSTDANVATVDEHGVVTPVSPGRTYIVVTQAGTDVYKSVTTYVIVDVKGVNAEATVNPTVLHFENKNATTQTVTYLTKNDESAPVVTSDKTHVATVSVSGPTDENGKKKYIITVTPKGEGSAKITITQARSSHYTISETSVMVSVGEISYGTPLDINEDETYTNYWGNDAGDLKWFYLSTDAINQAIGNVSNATTGVEITLDYTGITGIASYWLGNVYNGDKMQLKDGWSGSFDLNHAVLSENPRHLVIRITKAEWTSTFNFDSGDADNKKLYFGTTVNTPVAAYVKAY